MKIFRCLIYSVIVFFAVLGTTYSFSAGNPFETNIKTDPTALVLRDVVHGSGASALNVEPGQNWYFYSGETVVGQRMEIVEQYGAVVADTLESATYYGRAWITSPFFTLDSGETKEFYIKFPDEESIVFSSFAVPSTTGETLYEILRQANISNSGATVRLTSLNSYVQTRGGYQLKTEMYQDPVYTGGIILEDATERWGSGKKEGGSGGFGFFRVASPLQELIIRFTSFGNTNNIKFTILGKEYERGQ